MKTEYDLSKMKSRKNPYASKLWEREAERREAELKSGECKAIPAAEAISRLRARLQR